MVTVLLFGVQFSCTPFVLSDEQSAGESLSTEPDADTDTDTDSSSDSDSDTGTDSDSDTGTDSDNDNDTDSDSKPKKTEEIEVDVVISSDWGSGFCTTVSVTNNGTSAALWETTYDVGGSITTLWNAQATPAGALTLFVGEQWNDTLQSGESTSYGYCAER